MKYILSIVAVGLIGISIFSCSSQIKIANQDIVDQLLKQLNNSNGSDVLVISHRGDWRNFPENSLISFPVKS